MINVCLVHIPRTLCCRRLRKRNVFMKCINVYFVEQCLANDFVGAQAAMLLPQLVDAAWGKAQNFIRGSRLRVTRHIWPKPWARRKLQICMGRDLATMHLNTIADALSPPGQPTLAADPSNPATPLPGEPRQLDRTIPSQKMSPLQLQEGAPQAWHRRFDRTPGQAAGCYHEEQPVGT